MIVVYTSHVMLHTNLPGNETWQGYQMISIITSCTYCSDQRGTIFVSDCSDYSNERNYLEYGMSINNYSYYMQRLPRQHDC